MKKFVRSEQFETSLSPADAAACFISVTEGFQFNSTGSGGGGLYGGSHGSPRGDFFLETYECSSSAGENSSVVCRWIKDGRTSVQLQSDIGDARFDQILKAYKSQIDAAVAAKAQQQQ